MRYFYLFSKILSAQLLLDRATFGYEGDASMISSDSRDVTLLFVVYHYADNV